MLGLSLFTKSSLRLSVDRSMLARRPGTPLFTRRFATEYSGARVIRRRPQRQGPSATTVLACITAPCVAATFYETYARDRAQRGLYQHFSLSLHNLRAGRWYTLFTASFLHSDFWHLGANLLGLWSFGANLVPVIGATPFIALYVGGVLAGSAASLLNKSVTFDRPSVGASAGVLATVTVTALLSPWSTIYIVIVPVPAVLALGGMVAFDVWNLSNQRPNGRTSIDSAGHLGGETIGVTYWMWRFLLRR